LSTHAALDALVCGYASRVRSGKVIVIVGGIEATHVAYVDESGGPGAGRILLLSACVHRYPVWASFRDEWDRVLQESPAITAFHVRDARCREGEFAGWTQLAVDYKIIALTQVLLTFEPHVVTCWLSEEEYATTVRAASPPDVRHAYFLLFMCVVIKVAEYQQRWNLDTPVDYVFDEKGDVGYEAAMWYPVIKDSLPEQIKSRMGSTPIFRNDEKVLPLQAADLIAWNSRRKREFPGFDVEREASKRLDDLHGAEIHFGTQELEMLAGRTKAILGIQKALGGISQYKRLKQQYRKALRRKACGYESSS